MRFTHKIAIKTAISSIQLYYDLRKKAMEREYRAKIKTLEDQHVKTHLLLFSRYIQQGLEENKNQIQPALYKKSLRKIQRMINKKDMDKLIHIYKTLQAHDIFNINRLLKEAIK